MQRSDTEVALAVYERYRVYFDGEVQGCCMLIADEIQRAIGGEVVAGYIVYGPGGNQRTHWWVEKDGRRFDPMGDDLFQLEDLYQHVEAHRNRATFNALLPDYEQWRAPLPVLPTPGKR